MKIVVLGGYGVFGTKLVDLLTRDGHDVIVAGRSLEKATAMAAQFGAGALAVDRAGDLSPLWAANPDAVVDAAGPFHAYGDDPYAFARSCRATARRVGGQLSPVSCTNAGSILTCRLMAHRSRCAVGHAPQRLTSAKGLCARDG